MILFVDDELRRMDPFIVELALAGHEVCPLNNVDDALKFFENHSEEIDLIILDIMMPPGSSFEQEDTEQGLRTGLLFYRKIRGHAPLLPVIVFTNVSDEAVAENFSQEAHCIFMRKKDYLPSQLTQQVNDTLIPPPLIG